MNNHARGAARDRLICQFVEKGLFVSTEQVHELFFRDVRHRQKCQERLRKLIKDGRLRRRKPGTTLSYVYYGVDREWSQKWQHYVNLNWVVVAADRQRRSWHQVKAFVTEYFVRIDDKRNLRADALLVLENTVEKKLQPVLVEMDMGTNELDKVPKYTEAFKAGHWAKDWWAKPVEGKVRFPRILVVTFGEKRKEEIDRLIREQNQVGLRFYTATVEQVKRDFYGVLSRERAL